MITQEEQYALNGAVMNLRDALERTAEARAEVTRLEHEEGRAHEELNRLVNHLAKGGKP